MTHWEPVSSDDDPRLAALAGLRDAWANPDRHSARDGTFIAEGPVVLERVVESTHRIECVAVTPECLQRCAGLLARVRDGGGGPSIVEHGDLSGSGAQAGAGAEDGARGVPSGRVHRLVVERATMERLAGFDVHRGLLAVVRRAPALRVGQVCARARVVLVMEGVSNHDNVGGLVRAVACLGPGGEGGGVILDGACADPLYRKALRVSVGYAAVTPWARWTVEAGSEGGAVVREGGAGAVAALRRKGFVTLALTPRGGSRDESADQGVAACSLNDIARRVSAGDRVALVVGAEGPGLREETAGACDHRVRIEMNARADSLNVTTAGAIALHALRHAWA